MGGGSDGERHLGFVWGSGEPEKVSGQGRCIRIFTSGPSVGRDGGGGWTAFQAWAWWSHEAVIGWDVGWQAGVGGWWTEEEPSQTETRQSICFGAALPGLAPLPTLATVVTSSALILKVKLGSPCGYSPGPPEA